MFFVGEVTIVTIIYQPSNRIFDNFDKPILLGDRHIIYFGKRLSAMDYFSSIRCYPIIPMNPTDFLFDLTNGKISDVFVPQEL